MVEPPDLLQPPPTCSLPPPVTEMLSEPVVTTAPLSSEFTQISPPVLTVVVPLVVTVPGPVPSTKIVPNTRMPKSRHGAVSRCLRKERLDIARRLQFNQPVIENRWVKIKIRIKSRSD